ncbi:MAG TPA: hypothetical protein VK859_12770, partial [bacterium]|nr:hypothetical protein [bacterium]
MKLETWFQVEPSDVVQISVKLEVLQKPPMMNIFPLKGKRMGVLRAAQEAIDGLEKFTPSDENWKLLVQGG